MGRRSHSERTIGNTCLATTVQNRISTKVQASMSRPLCEIISRGLKQTDITDWRFVDFSEVPRGPWSTLGENNTFVINGRKKGVKLTERSKRNEVGVIAR